MEKFNPDSYRPITTALNELGFIINFVEKQAHKTVISVSHCEISVEPPVSSEEQEANNSEASGE